MKTTRNFIRTCRTRILAGTGIVAIFLAVAAAASPEPPFLPLNVHVGEKAPEFSLPSADGGQVSLSQFAGHNVLLDFYEGYW